MSNEITTRNFDVRKDDFATTRISESTLSTELAPDEVLFQVGRLALTANNISYAATGDALGYWGFFPTDECWGRIPAMGWAEVIATANNDVAVGERVWGWFPFATHLKVVAGNATPTSFADVSEHRSGYAPVYAQFDRAAANPLYDPAREDQDSLLRGLFTTSWLVEDFLHVNDHFDAVDCLITSASSKTSIALGHSVRARGRLAAVGLTSQRNLDFCRELGCYDTVITYDDISGLDASRASVLVDMAGNARLLTEIHQHFDAHLKHSCRIGATHQGEQGEVANLPGPKPAFFFAPTHVKARSAELGAAEFWARLGGAYAAFRPYADRWLTIVHSDGVAALEATYQTVLAGQASPAEGHVVSL